MKVLKKEVKPYFEPVSIVLETFQEAQDMETHIQSVTKDSLEDHRSLGDSSDNKRIYDLGVKVYLELHNTRMRS